jgi:hypothetical protein
MTAFFHILPTPPFTIILTLDTELYNLGSLKSVVT